MPESYNTSIYETVDLSDAIYLETIGQYTFDGAEISVNSGSYNGECEGKTIIGENTSSAYCILGELTDLKLPQNGSLETIGENAFANNSNLTEISLPNTIKTIWNSAFSGNNLTKVIIPS